MISITSINEPLKAQTSEEVCAQISPLQRENGIDLLCCQSIPHTREHRDNGQIDDSRQLSALLGLTCSCFASGRQPTPAAATGNHTLTGLAILTGTGVWVLNSGSFLVGEGSGEEVVLFALVRKNGASVLVFNVHLGASPQAQEQQLSDLFQHPLLKDTYGAVVLCANRPPMLPVEIWQDIASASRYAPQYQLDSPPNAKGLLCLLTAHNAAASTVSVVHPPPKKRCALSGLTLTLDIQRTLKSKRSRPSFPLSFREQWIGYRDQRAFA